MQSWKHGTGNKDYAYVAELEELEDRLLEAFKDTIQDDDTPAAAKAATQKYLPQVTECHDIMRNRKVALKESR